MNIGSVAERAPAPWEAMYSVSKAGVAMLSKCMRVEFAPLGVKVIHVRRHHKNIAHLINLLLTTWIVLCLDCDWRRSDNHDSVNG